MRDRLFLGALLLTGIVLPLTSCTNPSGLDSIAISPATQTLNVGQTSQLTVTGTYGNGSHLSTQTLSAGVTWSSNTTSVATVSATGTVTAVGAGTATITASAQGFRGPLTTTATITIGTTAGGGTTGGSLESIAVIPSSQTVALANQTTQFIAIGTTSSGATEYLTNAVTWSSSNTAVATIGATTGLATSVGAGATTITALYTNATTGSVVTGVATLSVTGGASEQFTALTLIPNAQALSASGQQAQFIALGTTGSTGLQENITSSAQLSWSSDTPSIATVTPAGLVAGVSAGSAVITAQYTNPDNSVVAASANVSVSLTAPPEPLLSLTIIPGSLSVANLQATGQFLAIGTFSTAPYTQDVTNSPNTTWISSFPDDFPVNTNSGGNSGASAGLVTAYANGSATIIAEYQNPTDKTIQTATATFNCPLALPNPNGDPPTAGSCYEGQGGPLLATLTVYNEGLNNTNWLITAPSATGTPDVIHCGPGWDANGNTTGSVCTATFPLNATVTLTAPAQAGVNFGGWSYNCTPTVAVNAAGPNSCTVTLTSVDGGSFDATVGAVFN
ncbi:MAG: Ig-like domain-containing protein [Terracidiphilus sp.]